MRLSTWLKVLNASVLSAALVVVLGSCGNRRDAIAAARNSYYNLPKQGVMEFRCSVLPDWGAILREELKTEVKPDNPALTLLNGVHFWVSVDRTGIPKLTHQIDSNPTTPSAMQDLQQAISGTEEATDGFWKTVSAFLFTPPLPRPGTLYKLVDQGALYEISYSEGGFDIVTRMAKDYAIVEIKATSAAVTSSLKPRFTKTNEGFLLTGYDTDYKLASGELARLSLQIKYGDIDGLQLPTKVVGDTHSNAGPHQMQLEFRDYQIKKR